MKKLFFAFPIIALLAAGCNSAQQASVQAPAQTPVVQNTNPTPTQISTPTPKADQTSNWKTYQNTTYSFSFRYPADWMVNDASYTYGGQKYPGISVSSPLFTGVPGASRETLFVEIMSGDGNKPWSQKQEIWLSLRKSDGGAVDVNVSQQYLQSIAQYQISQLIWQSLKTNTSASSNLQTYAGSGISFQYDPQTIAVSAPGNKIYLDDPTDAAKNIHTGDFIQVFNKGIEDSLTDAIWNTALTGLSSSQCIVNTTTNFNYFNRFNVVDVQAARNSGSSPAGSCPSFYIDAGSPGFFIQDPEHPTLFVFWRSGAAINLDIVESTLKFTTGQ